MAFRSHWGFEASFCTPGEGHEKGGVEGEGGFFRRNHFVPVPSVRDLDELNAMLGCREDEARVIDGRQQTIGEALAIERQHLLPLPSEGFDLIEVSFGQIDGLRRVKAKTNAYSAPVAPGTTVQVKLAPATVEIWHQGRSVARHARSYDRHQEILDLDHYLDVLEHKPGAFAGSKPLEQWRRAGRWPASYDQYWQALMERQGRQLGTKAMIELLQLGGRQGHARLRKAIESALQLGCTDAAAVRHLMTADDLLHQRPALLVEIGSTLSRYERPLPHVRAYDELLVALERAAPREPICGRRHPAACAVLHLPTVASQCTPLAEQAERERQPVPGLPGRAGGQLEIASGGPSAGASKKRTCRASNPDGFDFARRRWSRRRS